MQSLVSGRAFHAGTRVGEKLGAWWLGSLLHCAILAAAIQQNTSHLLPALSRAFLLRACFAKQDNPGGGQNSQARITVLLIQLL